MNIVHALDIADPNVNPVAKYSDLATILNILIPLISTIGMVFALIMFFRGGMTLLTGQGSADAIKKAQGYFIYAIIGILVIVSSMFMVKILAVILNIGPLPF